MNFLNPLVLIGLIAASIPLILHLLNLRKLKTVDFSTLRFLKELQKSQIRKLKIKQIILLILRTLIVIFAVLAFSRPIIKSNIAGLGQYAKTSTIILIDNSPSMDVSDESGNRFKQSRNLALSIIDNLKDGDEAAIIPMASADKPNLLKFTRNLVLLRNELNTIKISNTAANLEKSLRLAGKIMDESNNLSREVYILTDAQRNVFENEIKDSVRILPPNTYVYFIPVGYSSSSDIQNLSIDSINVNNRIFQKGQPVEVESYVHNHSSKEIKGGIVSLFFNDERVSQRAFDISANETRVISLTASPQIYGTVKARIELEEDALNSDNRRYFGFETGQKPNVAIFGKAEVTSFMMVAFGSKSSIEQYAN
ncbi:MAG: BatA domain-containing protein, partial [Bacteroidota bacterium]